MAAKILAEPNPKKNRKQGRHVKNFNANVWNDSKFFQPLYIRGDRPCIR
jgi:hypothetical protein